MIGEWHFFSLSWEDLGVLFTIACGLGAAIYTAVYAILLTKLRQEFADRETSENRMRELNARLDSLDQKLSQVPSHVDITALNSRVSRVESGVEVVGTKIDGLRQEAANTGRMVEMIMKHLLEKEQG